MFLELDKEPKRITIQFKNRAGKWYDYATVRHSELFNFEAVEQLLKAYGELRSAYDEERDVRAVVKCMRPGVVRQAMAYKNLEFYDWLRRNVTQLTMGTFISVVNKKTKRNALYSTYDSIEGILPIDHFSVDIQLAGGIKKAKARKETIHDGYLKVWDIELNNGMEYSVAALLPGRD